MVIEAGFGAVCYGVPNNIFRCGHNRRGMDDFESLLISRLLGEIEFGQADIKLEN